MPIKVKLHIKGSAKSYSILLAYLLNCNASCFLDLLMVVYEVLFFHLVQLFFKNIHGFNATAKNCLNIIFSYNIHNQIGAYYL